jgi:hypothetical protein
VAHNLGFNNGQQMAGARVTTCLPVFNDRRQGVVINANNSRDARSYANNAPSRFDKLGNVVRHLQLCGRYCQGITRGVVVEFNRKD